MKLEATRLNVKCNEMAEHAARASVKLGMGPSR